MGCSCSDDKTTSPNTQPRDPYRYDTSSVNSMEGEKTGEQEIHTATRDNNITHVKFLLENGADVNAQTTDSKDTPLHIAARINSRTGIALLIGSNADDKIKNADGKLAIDLCDQALRQQFELQTALRTMESKYVFCCIISHIILCCCILILIHQIFLN